MSNHSMLRFASWVVTPMLMCACAGQPVIDIDGMSGGVKGGASGQTTDDPNGTGGAPVQITTGQAGDSFNGGVCKATCGPKECGPVSNQCGGFIECGGCTAPEICGGSGIPSVCGASNPTCIPTTCAVLGATCGMQSDGCGGILDCWSEAAKASGATPACEVAGQLCFNGTCTSTIPVCTKLTCNDYAGNPNLCGAVSDGCSGVLDCGFTCGVGEGCVDSKCTKLCTPISCSAALATLPAGYCDVIPDGCGGIISNCSTVCTGGDTCGGGTTSGICGHGTTTTCTPKSVADCGTTCGSMPDGCNGIVQCPTTCPTGQSCGGDPSKPGQCGTSTSVCTPTTCSAQRAACGQIPDLCQGLLNCGSCTDGKVCGSSNTCVTSTTTCTPKTKAEICTGICGLQGDGCGTGTVDCGGCPTGQFCGGGGFNICGGTACTAKTQAEICNYTDSCGYQSDGCSGSVNCGGCTWPKTCVGTKGVCTMPTIAGCTNLCPYIDSTCTAAGKTPTQLTGKVYAPNGTTPLYNALVYVPNGAIPPISTGATCERCENENLGNPIAAALTGPDGSFTLKNIPAGTSFPLVVKMGKWRRVVTIPAVSRCGSLALTSEQTRLPKHKTDADAANVQYVNIPRFAVVSGLVDAMECVVRKIGVADTEFTRPSGTGRIHMYRAPVNFNNGNVSNGGGGVMGCVKYKTGSTTQCASAYDADVVQDKLADLFTNNRLNQYDIAVFDCEGRANDHDTYDTTLRSWADTGGRVFASHYSYKYLDDNGTFANSAAWGGTAPSGSSDTLTTGIIDKSDPINNPKGVALNKWLGNVSAWSPTYGDGYISITDPRYYVKSVNAGSERFIYTDTAARVNGAQICDANGIEQYAFNTPFKAAANSICGRVLYSAFHVAGTSAIADKVFPSYCSTGALTAQEKVLMFMLFDLSACVSVGEPPTPPTCTKNTCAGLGATCGSLSDGCGGLLECGTCVAPESCGGGGVANQCGNNCTRTTCGAQGANCGVIADGCGGILECGTCVAPAICGGGGTANVCGTPVCTPRACADVGAQCGFISDGCGSTVDCGTCTSPKVCGGGGTPNVCSTGTCTPSGNCGTAKCGFVSDGCGDTVSCGSCPTGFTCVSGVCTGTTCTKRTCSGIGCGFIGDGCGGVLDCGDCVAPAVCGGGGVASQCGGDCIPRTCAQAGAGCGAISDRCGGIVECGVCVAPMTCGGGGTANQCGTGTTCVPRSCTQADAECGSVGDGCGGVLNCGVCIAPLSCGGAGVANHCGTGGCVPLTCSLQGANCGPVADGCGNLLDCGTCTVGETCGGGGVASQCGKTISW